MWPSSSNSDITAWCSTRYRSGSRDAATPSGPAASSRASSWPCSFSIAFSPRSVSKPTGTRLRWCSMNVDPVASTYTSGWNHRRSRTVTPQPSLSASTSFLPGCSCWYLSGSELAATPPGNAATTFSSSSCTVYSRSRDVQYFVFAPPSPTANTPGRPFSTSLVTRKSDSGCAARNRARMIFSSSGFSLMQATRAATSSMVMMQVATVGGLKRGVSPT